MELMEFTEVVAYGAKYISLQFFIFCCIHVILGSASIQQHEAHNINKHTPQWILQCYAISDHVEIEGYIESYLNNQ